MTLYRKARGFTLVELMLAMAFVGVLLVAIATMAMHIMHTYTKGLTIREVNQAGRTVTEDMQRTIASSIPFKVSPAKTGESSDEIDSKYVTRPGGGRLCTGAYTYAWNYGNTQELTNTTLIGGEDDISSLANVYNTYEDSEDDIRLVKVSDAGGTLCADPELSIMQDQARELLAAGDRGLAIHELTVSRSAHHDASGQAMYAIGMVLGTNDHSQLDASSTTCLPPSQGSGNEDFCAINQFNIIARAGNRSGSL